MQFRNRLQRFIAVPEVRKSALIKSKGSGGPQRPGKSFSGGNR
jgi:hypothetical protein